MNLSWSRSWTRIVTHSFLFIGISAALVACGNKGSSTAAGPQGTQVQPGGPIFSGDGQGGNSNYDLSSYAMIIQNSRAVRSMKEQSNGSPKYYSIGGQLVPKRQAIRMLRSGRAQGKTLCMSRYNKSPRRGDAFAIKKASGGGGSEGYAYSASLGSRAFSLVCIKASGPISLSDIQQSTQGIVDFQTYTYQGQESLSVQQDQGTPEVLPYQQGW